MTRHGCTDPTADDDTQVADDRRVGHADDEVGVRPLSAWLRAEPRYEK